jgi:predicted Zn-ribbon and HTH transcriptional regulator
MFGDALSNAAVGGVAAAVVLLGIAMMMKPPKCEKCGTVQPKFHRPTTTQQAMWGGYTCANCGSELDRKGRVRK